MSPPPLFDSYVMVDWSAAAVPRRGRDSIWICHLRRERGRLRRARLENPETRVAARTRLMALLQDELREGRSVLSGFDFPFGYPAGFARRLEGRAGDWRVVWDLLGNRLRDGPKNANNRFDVAAWLNERVSGEPAPFWGCPAGAACAFLRPRHHRRHESLGLAERRLADERARGPQPVWKLYGNGSAGSQALTGIPVLAWLKRQLGEKAVLWPFETGLSAPERKPGGRTVFAEIYPSLVTPKARPGQIKDAAQVQTIARYFAELDDAAALAPLFAGDPALDTEARRRVEQEESWILGITANHRQPVAPGQAVHEPRRFAYISDPAAIYRESFARIRAETDLAAIPAELHGLALRLIHAAGDPQILGDLVWSPRAIGIGRAALKTGGVILADSAMVAAGITRRLLPSANRVICTLRDRRVAGLAKRLGTTRSAAAVELWRPHLAGAVIAIGNAPTALFRLLELLEAGAPRPALVLGFPVGFVGAAEAKAALAENTMGVPFIALGGRRGGSALAAAAVNALAGGEVPG